MKRKNSLLIIILVIVLSLFASCSSNEDDSTASEDDGSATMEEIQEETNAMIAEDPFLSFPQALYDAGIPHSEEEADLDTIGADDGVVYRLDDGTVGLLFFYDDSEMLQEAKKSGQITMQNQETAKITLNENYGLIMNYDGKYEDEIKKIFSKLKNTDVEK